MGAAALLALLPSVVSKLLTSKLFWIVAGIVAAVIAFTVYTAHIKHAARAEVLAEVQKETDAESARRLQIINATRAAADKAEAALAAVQHNNEKLRNDIARLSAANDSKPCLDGTAVDRLRAIGRYTPGR
jgi:phosphate/sulfate permease